MHSGVDELADWIRCPLWLTVFLDLSLPLHLSSFLLFSLLKLTIRMLEWKVLYFFSSSPLHLAFLLLPSFAVLFMCCEAVAASAELSFVFNIWSMLFLSSPLSIPCCFYKHLYCCFEQNVLSVLLGRCIVMVCSSMY